MEGMDNIKEKVLEQARIDAQEIIAEAKSYQKKILDDEMKEQTEREKELQEKLRATQDREAQTTEATVTLEKRNANLRAKRAVIQEVKEKALDELENLDEERRHRYLLDCLKVFGKDGDIVLLNRQDQELFPRLEDEAGLQLTLGDVADIRGGMILLQAEQRIDLSFDKYFEMHEADLTEQVARDLWGGGLNVSFRL